MPFIPTFGRNQAASMLERFPETGVGGQVLHSRVKGVVFDSGLLGPERQQPPLHVGQFQHAICIGADNRHVASRITLLRRDIVSGMADVLEWTAPIVPAYVPKLLNFRHFGGYVTSTHRNQNTAFIPGCGPRGLKTAHFSDGGVSRLRLFGLRGRSSIRRACYPICKIQLDRGICMSSGLSDIKSHRVCSNGRLAASAITRLRDAQLLRAPTRKGWRRFIENASFANRWSFAEFTISGSSSALCDASHKAEEPTSAAVNSRASR